MNYNYYTQDGHLMKNGEIMWRICCSQGILFLEPIKCVFNQNTGYNHLYITNEKQYSRPNLNPYSANHLHYYLKKEAEKQLKLRKA